MTRVDLHTQLLAALGWADGSGEAAIQEVMTTREALTQVTSRLARLTDDYNALLIQYRNAKSEVELWDELLERCHDRLVETESFALAALVAAARKGKDRGHGG